MNFIEEKIIKRENKETLIFRFPPNPNFHLHLGHAKSICLNFELAKKFNGKCNLRFDDTNPVVEKEEYIDSIIEDIEWLGYKPDNIFYASDYFTFIYDCAVKLIKSGKAYVDDSTSEDIARMKGTPTTAGIDSPYKSRTVEENLKLFNDMNLGIYSAGSKTLRANIDMSSPNMFLRDPIIYRIIETPHHRTGDKWKVYPMYDFTHPISDWLENITDSLCSNEFEIHKPLYMWVLENCGLDLPYPDESEFSRLNIEGVNLSKRHLKSLVEAKEVSGYSDPRLPTLKGLKRKGYSPESIRMFCDKMSATRRESIVSLSMLDDCLRDDLINKSKKIMAVFNPLKIVVENINGGFADIDEKSVYYSKKLYIEREDFMEVPDKDFFRLSLDKYVRLKGIGIITAKYVVKDERGIKEVICELVEDKVKVKSTIQWVSVEENVTKNIVVCNGMDIKEVPVIFESNIREIAVGERIQLMRKGYAINWNDHLVLTCELKR